MQFDVERRGNGSTRIEICCATNPEVLLSTVSALEVLGLEIEQCVVSCFSDFGMQASCSQVSSSTTCIWLRDRILFSFWKLYKSARTNMK